jgi:hypothetical protein
MQASQAQADSPAPQASPVPQGGPALQAGPVPLALQEQQAALALLATLAPTCGVSKTGEVVLYRSYIQEVHFALLALFSSGAMACKA